MFYFHNTKLKIIKKTSHTKIFTDLESKNFYKFTKRKNGNFVLVRMKENQTTLLKNYQSENNDHICNICADNISRITMKCCSQKICESCILQNSALNSKKCPFCNTDYQIERKLHKKYVPIIENELLKNKKLHQEKIQFMTLKFDEAKQKIKILESKIIGFFIRWNYFISANTQEQKNKFIRIIDDFIRNFFE